MAKKVKEPKENQEPKKKHNWKRIGIIVLVICVVSVIVSIFMPSEEKKEETQVAQVETQAETEAETSGVYEWDAGELAEYGLSREELLHICDEYTELLIDDSVLDMDVDEEVEYEHQCAEQVGEDHGLTGEDVDHIYRVAMMPNYFATFDVNDVKLEHGDLQSILVNEGIIVIKNKITPLFTNKQTIEQNYFTVTDFIKRYVGDEYYDEIQYWAVADMTSGKESKCISFTVPNWIIESVASGQFIDNQLGDYADDLWILPSLLN